MNYQLVAIGITAATMVPTMAGAAILTYAQIFTGQELRPEWIVGGVMLIAGLSLWIVQKWVREFFTAMDSVPKLGTDVNTIKGDIGEIKETVKGLLPWKEETGKMMAVMLYRLDLLERSK